MDDFPRMQERHARANIPDDTPDEAVRKRLDGVPQEREQVTPRQEFHDENKAVSARHHGSVDVHRVRAPEAHHRV